MLVIKDNLSMSFKEPTFIALGSFDGIHRGHLELINETLGLAKKYKAKSMVFTFENHPLSMINPNKTPKLLQENEEKIKIFEKLGLDILNLADFNQEFMKLSPSEFIEALVKHYNAKGVVVGFNYKFGHKNLGNIELLQKLSEKLNFKLKVIKPITINNEVVSSSKIRSLILEGNINKANEFLTRPYEISGEVICGKQIGRTIGFPTANLKYNTKRAIPSKGVYYTMVEYKGKIYKAITNVGYNPTVNGNTLSIESHLLDFDKSIYGEKIKIYFIEKIREEEKFSSLELLKKQLQIDKLYAISK